MYNKRVLAAVATAVVIVGGGGLYFVDEAQNTLMMLR